MEDQILKGLVWRTSSNNNPTAEYSGLRVTIFPSDGGWKYSVADEEETDDDEEEPYFSARYASQDAATVELAKWLLSALPTDHDTEQLLLTIARRVGDDAKSIGAEVVAFLQGSVTSDHLLMLNDRLGDRVDAVTRLIERAEDIEAEDTISALEHIDNLYENLSSAVNDRFIEAVKAERLSR